MVMNVEEHLDFMIEDASEFNEWLESIVFVDSDGIPIAVELEKDVSADPEDDIWQGE